MTMLSLYFIKSIQQSLSLQHYLCKKNNKKTHTHTKQTKKSTKISIDFNKLTGWGNMLNSIQTDIYFSENKDIDVFDFSWNCDLE